jgi:hypothetical protein
MADFEGFLEQALVAGRGRKPDGTRRIPTFVPSGTGQDLLFDTSIELFRKNKFHLFNISGTGGYKKALNSFALHWPIHSEANPLTKVAYAAQVLESETSLLIVCGSENMPRFWTNLYKSSALHIGALFPPFRQPTEQCIAVPDVACVCAIVKERDFSNFSNASLDPVFRYTSEKSAWIG